MISSLATRVLYRNTRALRSFSQTSSPALLEKTRYSTKAIEAEIKELNQLSFEQLEKKIDDLSKKVTAIRDVCPIFIAGSVCGIYALITVQSRYYR